MKNGGTCIYGVVSGRSGGALWDLMVKWLSDKVTST